MQNPQEDEGSGYQKRLTAKRVRHCGGQLHFCSIRKLSIEIVADYRRPATVQLFTKTDVKLSFPRHKTGNGTKFLFQRRKISLDMALKQRQDTWLRPVNIFVFFRGGL
jgi:hypothetical protein